MISQRQELVLRKVIELYLQFGEPVGSKVLAQDEVFHCGASTLRAELSALEAYGFLAHPHTSAGRVPTDAGYRYLVDEILTDKYDRDRSFELVLAEREVEQALQATSETLSQVTNLLAVISAPPLQTATIRHIELLTLQPHVLMVVIITSTGDVSKRLFEFDAALDTGLVQWAAEYLNERLKGLALGARTLRNRLALAELEPLEQAFLGVIIAAFAGLVSEVEQTLYTGGAARLLQLQGSEVTELKDVVEMLEQRATMLTVLRQALQTPDVYVRIGSENSIPALRQLAVVAASYGLPNRPLGAVSLIGPVRMDYPQVIRTIRTAAQQLSHYMSDIYTER